MRFLTSDCCSRGEHFGSTALAYMWYNLAAAQKNEIAQENKNIIEQRMTREQIAEDQRLSREWLEAHPPSGN